jgi:hypothetical protein
MEEIKYYQFQPTLVFQRIFQRFEMLFFVITMEIFALFNIQSLPNLLFAYRKP